MTGLHYHLIFWIYFLIPDLGLLNAFYQQCSNETEYLGERQVTLYELQPSFLLLSTHSEKWKTVLKPVYFVMYVIL